MRTIKVIALALLFLVLTVLTQVGGVILLLSLLLHPYINRQVIRTLWRRTAKVMTFVVLYLAATFFIVPPLARPFGRVPLPMTETGGLSPLTILTPLLNRHYVKKQLWISSFEVAEQMYQAYPGTTVNYLDASFPFLDGFPLIPHLSHNDGRKLDLAFYYSDSRTGKAVNEAPSPIGYGVNEEPLAGEANTAVFCAQRGYWQYSLIGKLVPQGGKKLYRFDAGRTRKLVATWAANDDIGKVFLEPHLKERLHLTSRKIRFHGCGAVRHDDHIHVQLK